MVKMNIDGKFVGNEDLIFLPERGITPEIENTVVQVGNSNGVILSESRLKERKIVINFVVKTMSRREFEKTLAPIVFSNDVVPLFFDDRPDEIWYGKVDGNIDLERQFTIGKGTINFLCLDPFAYGKDEKTFTNVGNTITVKNNGTYPTPVSFNIESQSDNGFVG
ncbi:phage tail family protein, partial [Latilactobacillus curvatus]|uniref:distal tail protein Dit n=1 Tax=Latilactobacillus curvatus TaxID=28038 RepID=UPI00207415B0